MPARYGEVSVEVDGLSGKAGRRKKIVFGSVMWGKVNQENKGVRRH